MPPREELAPIHAVSAPRYAGWAVLTGLLGIVCVMIGVVLICMMQAPARHFPVVLSGFILIAWGVLLLAAVAWKGRHPKA